MQRGSRIQPLRHIICWALLLLCTACGCKTNTADAPETTAAPRLLSEIPATQLEVVAVDNSLDIAPIQPGELVSPNFAAGEGVGILSIGPTGAQKQAVQAVVVFDRPMVALSALDAPGSEPPLSCGPGLSGRARWAGTSTAVWVPAGNRFPMASSITCSVPAGARAVDGSALARTLDFTFETPPPQVTYSTPSNNAHHVDPAKPLLLIFNQPVTPDAVSARVELIDDLGNRLQLTGRYPSDGDDSWRLPENRKQAIYLDYQGELQRNITYRLGLGAGLRGVEGTRGTTEGYEIAFTTIPPPAVTKVSPTGTSVDPYTSISLNLETNTQGDEINKRLTITPAPPDGFAPARQYNSRWWSHGLRLEPMTTYTVNLASGARDQHGGVMEEGVSWQFTTGHMKPLVDMVNGLQLYPANNPPRLPLRSRNVADLNVAFQSVSSDWAMRNMLNHRTYGGTTRAVSTDPVDLSGETDYSDKVQIHEVDLSSALVDGRGLILVEAWSREMRNWKGAIQMQRTLLQVTDLGTTLKLGPDGVTAWVTRLSDGKPVENAVVTAYIGPSQAWSGSTDADGLAASPPILPADWNSWKQPLFVVAELGEDRVITTHQDPHKLSTYDFGVWPDSPNTAQQLRVHSFADRGVYKRGEVAHIALTARLAGRDGLSQAEGAQVHWKCSDALDSVIAEGSGQLDRHGAFSFDVSLPDEIALGTASCRSQIKAMAWVDPGQRHWAAIAGSTWTEIPVKAYRAPTFRVDVSAPAHATVGESLTAVGRARYLFGAPMVGVDARWTLRAQETDPQPPGWSEFSFRNNGKPWWESTHYPVETLSQWEGVLDGSGEVQIEHHLAATDKPGTRAFTVEVEATDIARQAITNRAEVLVHPSNTYAGIRFARGLGEAGQPLDAEVVTVTPGGEIVPGTPVELSFVRRSWDTVRQKDMDGHWQWVNTPNDTVVESRAIKSGEQASVTSWTPPEGGYYLLRAEARDEEGRISRSESGIYVTGEGAYWARDSSNKVELVPDRRRYRPGDVAQVLVKAPRPGLYALLTVEREGVLRRSVHLLESTAESLPIEIDEQSVPNLFVSVVLVDGAPPADSPQGVLPEWFLGYTQLDIEPAGRRLDVEIATDSTRYQPGDEVTATVQVKRDGQPVGDAHIVLYAVDYGVLSLTGYKTPDAMAQYYSRHPLRVYTADNRTQILDRSDYLSKGADPGGGGGDERLRKHFVTTPLWKPNVATGEDGVAQVRFKLPDNLTTFQLMAVVDADAGSFGSDSHELEVARPLMAQPALPRLLRTGDLAFAGIVVHNNTDEERDVLVTAQARGITLEGAPRTVRLAAHAAREVAFDLRAPQPGTAELLFEVSAGEDRDAVRITFPIHQPRAVETVATAGSTTELATEQIALVKGAQDGVGGLEVRLSPTVLVGSDASVSYLLDYPHGCLEQVSSRLMAALVAEQLRSRIDPGRSAEELSTFVHAGLTALESFKHSSGGMSLWPGARNPAPVATAYAMEAAALAGQQPSEDTVRFLRRFLDGNWMQPRWSEETRRSAQARVALHLARVGRGEPGYNANLYQHRQLLSLTAQAELAEAIALTSGRNARSAELLRVVTGAVSVDPVVARIEPPPGRAWSLWGSRSSTSAAAVSAIIEAQPQHPLLERLARGLVGSRSQGRWGNTYTSLAALSALSRYSRRFEGRVEGSMTRVQLAGRPVVETDFSESSEVTGSVPMSRDLHGPLAISTEGGRVYYEMRLSYSREEMPPRDAGFTILRRYEMLEGVGSGTSVTPGAIVRVHLRIVTPTDRHDVAVIDPLPAGLEPIDTGFATSANHYQEETGANDEYDEYDEEEYGDSHSDQSGSAWVFNHRELDDDGLLLYADYMPAGIHVYSYLARATTPGDYANPAATVEEMYRPETFGRTSQGRFVVGYGPVSRAD
jgi:uncharacterized protein YfaS (alpha-2-macroglobulin family)